MSDSLPPHGLYPTRLLCPWDFPDNSTGMDCHFLLQCMKVQSLSHVQLFVTLWTAAYQAPLSLGFSRQEHWTGVPWPSPRIEDRVVMNLSCGQCPRWCSGKKCACNAGDTGDLGLIPGLGKSPGGANGNLLQYFFLKSPMGRGVHWVAKSRTQLSSHAKHYSCS